MKAQDSISAIIKEFNNSAELMSKQGTVPGVFTESIKLMKFVCVLKAIGVLAQTIENGSIVIATAIIDSKDNKETGND